jgi:predicted N-formylglutamate amidohydrolase
VHLQQGAVALSCEHASNRVPRPWRASPSDRALLEMHWGYDIGAARVTRAACGALGGWALLSRFSRLLCDPNRGPDDPTLVLTDVDEGAVGFNRRGPTALRSADARVARFHVPFHAALDATLRRARPRLLLSVHTFTPVFRGHRRPMEAGVLFDRHDDLAERLIDALRAQGLRTEANAPYSGKDGLIYSAQRHGLAHGLPYLELEVRQDLVAGHRGARAVARTLVRALSAAGL